MSDTPRTDAEIFLAGQADYQEKVVPVEHALQLERELSEAKSERDKYLTRIQLVEEYQINDELLKQRDRWRLMAEELAYELRRFHRWKPEKDMLALCPVLERFNTLKGESK